MPATLARFWIMAEPVMEAVDGSHSIQVAVEAMAHHQEQAQETVSATIRAACEPVHVPAPLRDLVGAVHMHGAFHASTAATPSSGAGSPAR